MAKRKDPYRRNQQKRFGNKKFFFGFCIVFIGLLLLFRERVVCTGLQAYIRFCLPKSIEQNLVYDKCYQKDGHLILEGLSWKQPEGEIKLDQIDLFCAVELFPFCIKPHVVISHPEVHALHENFFFQESAFSLSLIPTKRYIVKLDIYNGVLQFPSMVSPSRLYFSFQSGEKDEEIGALTISHDPSATDVSFLTVEFKGEGKDLHASLVVENCDVAYLAPLSALVSPSLSKGWNELQGQFQVKADISLDEKLSLKKLSCETNIEHLLLVNPTLGLFCQADIFKGHFSYPPYSVDAQETLQEQKIPFWKKAEAYFTLSEGQLSLSSGTEQWGCKNMKGELLLLPAEDPSLALEGEIFSNDFERHFEIEGKGFVHEDGSFWLQSNCSFVKNLASVGEDKTHFFVSLCRLENDDLTLQSDFKNVPSEFLELGKKAFGLWPFGGYVLEKGKLEGSVIAHLQKTKAYSVEWSQLSGKNLVIQGPGSRIQIPEISSNGQMKLNGLIWSASDLHVSIQKANLQFDAMQGQKITECSADIHIQDDQFMPSKIEGIWGGDKTTVTFLGPEAEYFLHCESTLSWKHLLTLVGNPLPTANEIPILFMADVKRKERALSFEGRASFVIDKENTEELQMGWELTKDFSHPLFDLFSYGDLKEHTGWLRTEKLSSIIYGPLIKKFAPAFSTEGNVDLFGVINQKGLELSIQSSELIVDNPAFFLCTGPIGEKDASLLKTEGRAQFLYDFQTKTYQGSLPLGKASFKEKSSGIFLEKIHGTLTLNDTVIESSQLEAFCHDILVPFKLHIDEDGIFIETEEVKGKIESLIQVLHQFPQARIGDLPVKGDFIIPKQGCALLLQNTATTPEWHWKINSHLTQGSYQINTSARLDDVSFDLSYDSSDSLFSLTKIKGKCFLTEKPYSFTMNDFCFDSSRQESPFDLKFLEGSQESARFAGQFINKPQFSVRFDSQKTHVLKIPLQFSDIILDKDLSIAEFQMKPVLEMSKLQSTLELMKNMGLLSFIIDEETEKLCKQLQGKIDAEIYYKKNPSSLDVALQSEALTFNDKASNFALKARKQGDGWVIERLQWNPYFIQTCLVPKKDHIAFPYFKMKTENAQFEGEGAYFFEKKEIQVSRLSFAGDLGFLQKSLVLDKKKSSQLKGSIQGKGSCRVSLGDHFSVRQASGQLELKSSLNAPVGCDVSMRQPMVFFFDALEGVRTEKIHLLFLEKGTDEIIGQFAVEKVEYEIASQKLGLPKYDLLLASRGVDKLTEASIAPKWLGTLKRDKQWQATGDFSLSKDGYEISCYLKDGKYILNEKELDLKQIRLQVHPSSFYLKCKTELQKQPLFIDLQTDLSPSAPIYVQIKEQPDVEGLRLLLTSTAGEIACERAEGKLLGLEMNIKQDKESNKERSTAYYGSVKINFAKAKSLFSPELAKPIQSMELGAGYEMQGHFFISKNPSNPFRFVGDIQGQDFSMLGYSLQYMQAKADISLESSVLQDIRLEDPAGCLSMKICKIIKEPKIDKWNIFLPLIHIKDLRPSLLAKHGKREKTQKPFVIKNLSVYDLTGMLGDSKSFIGNGSLNFANSYKKEFSLLDIPFSLIKDLGLDPGLLTPVAGEVDFVVEKGKCVLTDLRNSYSEGKRSEFFLSDENTSAYLDFDGNWHVDLKMKQHVVLKWTESFVLTIRGKLDKPKYSLKNVDLFP